MKAVILCVLAAVAISLARPKADSAHYTSAFDGINLDEILGNKRLLMAYVQCVLKEGKCTPEGKELQSHMKEALETDCVKCTDAQRKGSEKVIEHLIKHEPESWNRLKAKYDPTGKYSKKYEARLSSVKA